MKNRFIIFVFFFGYLNLYSQKENIALKIYTFSETEKLLQQSPKPVVVFIHTDWCKICFAMKQKTFKNEEVIPILNNDFYFIMLNGEEKKNITFFNKTFVYKPTGINTGTHELAKELAYVHGRISYPTTVILNSKKQIDIQIDNYITSKKMKKILNKYLEL